MANFCLPKKYVETFRQALKAGKELEPEKLSRMASADRLATFSKVLGPEVAGEVNALFEEKMLLKDTRAAARNWVNQLQGLNDVKSKAIHEQINSLRDILNPADEKNFLESLVAKKLGTEVTPAEAKELTELASKASDLENQVRLDPDNRALRNQFGEARGHLIDKVKELKKPTLDVTDWRSWKDATLKAIPNVLNAPRTIMSSIDLSAPFVQGWGQMSTGRFWEGFTQMHKYFASEKGYNDLRSYILGHEHYELARKAKLGLTEIGDDMVLREENFQSNIPEELMQRVADFANKKIGKNVVPNPFRASDRAFSGFMNYVRFNRFSDLVNAAKLLGEDISPGSQAVRDIAKVINDSTGRGSFGKNDKWGHLSPLVNSLFFAGRKLSGDLNMFDVTQIARLSPTARKAYIRQWTGSILATSALIGLFTAMGGEVDLNPTSQNFGYVTMGKTRFDFTGGKRSWIRLAGQLYANQRINASGKVVKFGEGFKPDTRFSTIQGFLRGKTAPVASAVWDALEGTNAVGEPFSLSMEAKDKLVPMTMNAYLEFLHSGETDSRAMAMSLASIYGVSMQSPFVAQRNGLTMWGEPVDAVNHDEEDPLNQALEDLGYLNKPGRSAFPPKSINGVKLTDDQYHDYVMLSGNLAKQLLLPVVQAPGWSEMPAQMQESYIRGYIGAAQAQAQVSVMKASVGTPDDIFKKTLDKNEENKSAVLKADKKVNTLMKEPVRTEAELRKQWSELMLQDYDYGRMAETNPLAYLGYLAVKKNGVAHYFKSPLSALGFTMSDELDKTASDYGVIKNAVEEAGRDPNKVTGEIFVGPEFGRGENTFTLEHELMHRGFNELRKLGQKPEYGDHTLISTQYLTGKNGHSNELGSDHFMDRQDPDWYMKPKKEQEKIAERARVVAGLFQGDLDKVQEQARKLIFQRNK